MTRSKDLAKVRWLTINERKMWGTALLGVPSKWAQCVAQNSTFCSSSLAQYFGLNTIILSIYNNIFLLDSMNWPYWVLFNTLSICFDRTPYQANIVGLKWQLMILFIKLPFLISNHLVYYATNILFKNCENGYYQWSLYSLASLYIIPPWLCKVFSGHFYAR